ncbi:MAG TPA: hypothetical protein VIV09_12785, partial [Pseudolabrys sp.]
LDEVVQGFLKFIRPEELKLQPTPLEPLIQDLLPIVMAEAGKSGVDVRVDIPSSLPPGRFVLREPPVHAAGLPGMSGAALGRWWRNQKPT